MKRLIALVAVLMVSACAQTGDGFVQDPPANPDPNPQPDPIIATPINSRFTGRVAATVSGEAKDFDAILEFREQQAGKLIGYGQLRDKLAKKRFIKPPTDPQIKARGSNKVKLHALNQSTMKCD